MEMADLSNFPSAGNDLLIHLSIFLYGLSVHSSVQKELLLFTVIAISKEKYINLTDWNY